MSVSLNNIVQVNVQVSPTTAISNNFNLGCIMYPGTDDSLVGAHVYSKTNWNNQMITDGFDPTTDEDLFAMVSSYFAQDANPSRVAIYYWDESASGATLLNAFKDAIEETKAYAYYLTAISASSTSGDITDLTNCLSYAESFNDPIICFYDNFNDAEITSAGGFFATAKSQGWKRTIGFYTHVGSDEDPQFTAVAALGEFCGLNTLQQNSAYTFAYKKLTGLTPTDITDTQLGYITTHDGNSYLNFDDEYGLTYPGIMASGDHLDEIFFQDVVTTYIKQSVVNTLLVNKKIPQTDSGVNIIVNALASVCNRFNEIGFIGSGIWNGITVGDLESGNAIENGYYITAGSVANQTAEERASRISPPIQIALLSSGAVEHVVVSVIINR